MSESPRADSETYQQDAGAIANLAARFSGRVIEDGELAFLQMRSNAATPHGNSLALPPSENPLSAVAVKPNEDVHHRPGLTPAVAATLAAIPHDHVHHWRLSDGRASHSDLSQLLSAFSSAELSAQDLAALVCKHEDDTARSGHLERTQPPIGSGRPADAPTAGRAAHPRLSSGGGSDGQRGDVVKI